MKISTKNTFLISKFRSARKTLFWWNYTYSEHKKPHTVRICFSGYKTRALHQVTAFQIMMIVTTSLVKMFLTMSLRNISSSIREKRKPRWNLSNQSQKISMAAEEMSIPKKPWSKMATNPALFMSSFTSAFFFIRWINQLISAVLKLLVWIRLQLTGLIYSK